MASASRRLSPRMLAGTTSTPLAAACSSSTASFWRCLGLWPAIWLHRRPASGLLSSSSGHFWWRSPFYLSSGPMRTGASSKGLERRLTPQSHPQLLRLRSPLHRQRNLISPPLGGHQPVERLLV